LFVFHTFSSNPQNNDFHETSQIIIEPIIIHLIGDIDHTSPFFNVESIFSKHNPNKNIHVLKKIMFGQHICKTYFTFRT